jgi:hypothetical protein
MSPCPARGHLFRAPAPNIRGSVGMRMYFHMVVYGLVVGKWVKNICQKIRFFIPGNQLTFFDHCS